jgi:hypothetical protein
VFLSYYAQARKYSRRNYSLCISRKGRFKRLYPLPAGPDLESSAALWQGKCFRAKLQPSLDYCSTTYARWWAFLLVEQRLRELNPSTVSSLSPDNQSISLASAQFVFVAHAWQLSLSVPSHFSATTNNGDHTLTAGDLHIVRKCVVHIVSGELRTMYFYAAIW